MLDKLLLELALLRLVLDGVRARDRDVALPRLLAQRVVRRRFRQVGALLRSASRLFITCAMRSRLSSSSAALRLSRTWNLVWAVPGRVSDAAEVELCMAAAALNF